MQEFDNTQEISTNCCSTTSVVDTITDNVKQHFEQVKKNWIDSARKQVQIAGDIENYLQAICSVRKSMTSASAEKFADILEHDELWLIWSIDALEKKGKLSSEFDREEALQLLQRNDRRLWSTFIDYVVLHSVEDFTGDE
eukprot:252573-Prorocentrum_lima.AAC.1